MLRGSGDVRRYVKPAAVMRAMASLRAHVHGAWVSGFDVVIVGGGPAGCALALWLRRARCRVAIVDRARFPREKPCGEGLLPSGVDVLRALGLGDLLAKIEAPAVRALEFAALGARARGALPGDGAGVDRRRFDAALAAAAQDSGVVWVRGAPASLRRDGQGAVSALALSETDSAVAASLECSVLVGADGLRSWTRRALGLQAVRRGSVGGAARFGLCARVTIPHDSGDHVEVHIVPGLGELYVTPSGTRQLSLALLTSRARVRTFGADLSRAVRLACAASRSLTRRLEGASSLGPVQAVGPLAQRAVRPYGSGAFLAGDAALAVDPIGGDGMTLALVGSQSCARAVLAHLAGDEPSRVVEAYASALLELSRRRRAFVAALLGLASVPRMSRMVLDALSRVDGSISALCALHEGGWLTPRAVSLAK